MVQTHNCVVAARDIGALILLYRRFEFGLLTEKVLEKVPARKQWMPCSRTFSLFDKVLMGLAILPCIACMDTQRVGSFG